MSSSTLSRWSRLFVASGVCFLVAWQAAVVVDLPRRTAVTLGLHGFVLHVVFGKAYSLIPSYFDRNLAWPRATAVHLPLSLVGAVGLALEPLPEVTDAVGTVGAVAWTLGVIVFLTTLIWTLRDNPTGAETGTGDHNAHRAPIDRASNAFVPIALAYLAVGSWETLAMHAPVAPLLDGYPPRVTHLLAAGTAALLVFAVGFRLLSRFLVASVPRWLPWVVLPAGAVGPALLAVGLPAGSTFRAGAALETVAIVGWSAAYAALYRGTDRERVGFYGPLAGVAAALVAAGIGLSFAFESSTGQLLSAHYRLNLLGFLGLTIIGVTFQFYPPTVGRFPGARDRLALAAIAVIVVGLAVEIGGLAFEASVVTLAGQSLALVGVVAYAYLVLGVFVQRARG